MHQAGVTSVTPLPLAESGSASHAQRNPRSQLGFLTVAVGRLTGESVGHRLCCVRDGDAHTGPRAPGTGNTNPHHLYRGDRRVEVSRLQLERALPRAPGGHSPAQRQWEVIEETLTAHPQQVDPQHRAGTPGASPPGPTPGSVYPDKTPSLRLA